VQWTAIPYRGVHAIQPVSVTAALRRAPAADLVAVRERAQPLLPTF